MFLWIFEVYYYGFPEVRLSVVWQETTGTLLLSCDKEAVKVVLKNMIAFPQMKQEYALWRMSGLKCIFNMGIVRDVDSDI